MSSETKTIVLNEGVIRTLERLVELRNQRKSVKDPIRKGSIWKEIHKLQWEIAPALEPWIRLMTQVGLFEIQETGTSTDSEDEYMLGDPDYLPLLELVKKNSKGVQSDCP